MTALDAADLDHLLDVATGAAHAAGALVLDGFGAARNVREKGPGDFVSDTDTASEALVRELLLAAVPDIPVVGEEAGGERADLAWYVDPLDGTTNFVHGFPVVGVSIGLVDDGVPVVGVVHAPMLRTTGTARLGGGAHVDGSRVSVSERAPAQAVVATGFPFRAKDARLPRYAPVLDGALHDFEDLRRAGAASLDLLWSATGTFDGYFELALSPWDVAAGALLVREAGGIVTDWSGDDRAWLTSGDILAAPPRVHEHLLGLTRPPR